MTAADENELHKFAHTADQWWDPEGDYAPLHRIQPVRLDYIRAGVDLSDKRVLDVGCGGGLLAEGLAEAGARVTGVEPSGEAISAAREHLAVSGLDVDYRHGGIEDLIAAGEGPFDVVTCMEVLEHVTDPGALVQECGQLLAPGGTLFFATLNRTLRSYALAIIGAEYILGWLPRGTHDWSRFIRPAEMEAHLRAAGLRPEGFQGMTYHPLRDEFRLADDMAVNYLGYATKPEAAD